MKHNLDIKDNFFEDIKSGLKTFEVRRKNKNYQIGDTLILKNETTQKTISKTISYISHLNTYNINNIIILGLI